MVTGSYSEDAFRIKLIAVGTNIAYSVGAMFLLDTSGTSDFSGTTPATFIFVRSGETEAQGTLDLTGPGVAGGERLALDNLKLKGALHCCYADFGPAVVATKTPPIFLQ